MMRERDNKGRFISKAKAERKQKAYADIYNQGGFRSRGFAYGNAFAENEPTYFDLLGAYEDIVFACVNLIADNVANVDIKLLVSTGQGDEQPKNPTRCIGMLARKQIEKNYPKFTRKAFNVQEVVDHGLLDLLDKPNPIHTFHKLLQLTQTSIDLVGSAFWWINRHSLTGHPVELLLMPAQWMKIEPDDSGRGVKKYVYEPSGTSKKQDFRPEDIIHFKSVSPLNPYTGFGVSPLQANWQKLNLLRHEQSSWQAILNNMAFPSALVAPTTESEMWTDQQAERVAKQIEERFRYGNQGGVWVVQDAIKYTPISTPPKDLTALTMYDSLKQAICVGYGVPKPLIDMSETTGAGSTTAWRFFQKNCLKPRAINIVETLTQHLCPPRLFFATDEIVEPDRDYELQRTSALWQANLLTQNEARVTQGLEPVQGGERYLYQLIGTSPGQGGTMGTLPSFQSQNRSAPTTRTKAFNPKPADPRPLAVALRSFFKKMEGQVSLKTVPELRTKSFFPFDVFTKELADTITPALRLSYEEGSREVAAQLGGVPLLDVLNLSRAVSRAALVLADSTLRTTDQEMSQAVQATRDALEAGLAANEANQQLAARIKDIFTDLSDRRAMLIAETESARAKTAGEVMEIEESGVEAKKVWLSDSMACDICAKFNGAGKALNEPFAVIGTGPYAQIDHPPAHPACRCTLTYELGD